MSALQIKAISFDVAKHLFGPHTAAISSQGGLWLGEAGCRKPRFFFADFPINQQVDRISILGGQFAMRQPHALFWLVHQTIQALVAALARWLDQVAAFLAQNILPPPLFEQFLHLHFAKFSITRQDYPCFGRDQAV
jgi:hypothetical protein